MKPNWTALEALGRTLFILAASTFFGALVMPLAADGTLPTDWAHWRPVLAVGGSAAVAAEVIWIRAHLSAAASALGLPATQAAVKAAAALLLVVGLGRLLPACTPSQGQTATTVTNAVFSADQAACMAANEGLVGDSNAVKEFESLCNLAGPLDQAITTFIGDITQSPTAMARVAAERKAAGK